MYIRIQVEEGDKISAEEIRNQLCHKFKGEKDFIESRVVVGDRLLNENGEIIENEGFVHIFVDPESEFRFSDILFVKPGRTL